MSKGQIIGRPIFYILAVIVTAGVLFFGYQQISNLGEKNKEIQVINFVTSVDSEIDMMTSKSVGSRKESSFALPNEIDYACFVDQSKDIDFIVKNELKEQVEIYSDKNLFFAPFDDFSRHKIDGFELDEDENPLCIKNIDGKARVRFESAGNRTLLRPAEDSDKEVECNIVINHGDSDRKVDIVFLGYGYDEIEDYVNDVEHYTNDVLFEIEPFKSNKTKINIWRVDDMSTSCTVGDYIMCNEYEAKQLASKCGDGASGFDYIFVLVDRNAVADFFAPVRSSARGRVAKINTAETEDDFVLAHEFGHTFGNLADEYVDVYYEQMNFDPDDYENCGIMCSKWDGIDGADCFGTLTDNDRDGCSVDSAFRGSETSLMKDLGEHNFGPINRYLLQRELDFYRGS